MKRLFLIPAAWVTGSAALYGFTWWHYLHRKLSSVSLWTAVFAVIALLVIVAGYIGAKALLVENGTVRWATALLRVLIGLVTAGFTVVTVFVVTLLTFPLD